MSERNFSHATFAIERSYAVPPARVFEAWADPVAKSRWFGGDDWQHELEFRVGGSEVSTGTVDGTAHRAASGRRSKSGEGPRAWSEPAHEAVQPVGSAAAGAGTVP